MLDAALALLPKSVAEDERNPDLEHLWFETAPVVRPGLPATDRGLRGGVRPDRCRAAQRSGPEGDPAPGRGRIPHRVRLGGARQRGSPTPSPRRPGGSSTSGSRRPAGAGRGLVARAWRLADGDPDAAGREGARRGTGARWRNGSRGRWRRIAITSRPCGQDGLVGPEVARHPRGPAGLRPGLSRHEELAVRDHPPLGRRPLPGGQGGAGGEAGPVSP